MEEFISFVLSLIMLMLMLMLMLMVMVMALIPATLIAAVLSLKNIGAKYKRCLPLPGWALNNKYYLIQSKEAQWWFLKLSLLTVMLSVVLVVGLYLHEAIQ